MLSKKVFKKLKLNSKIIQLKLAGEFIAQRYFMHFKVSLYSYNGFFVEIWQSLRFDEVFSIDIAPERTIKEAYLDKIDLSKLGLEL